MNDIRHGNEELRNEEGRKRPYRYETDTTLRSILRDVPNASLQTIANTLSTSPKTVRTHMSRIGETLTSLRWIPHRLTSELNKFVSICVYNCSRDSLHTRTIIGGISSRGMRIGFIMNMFGAGYGPHGMRTRLKWRTAPLPPRKLC
jgi:hypothetical protein